MGTHLMEGVCEVSHDGLDFIGGEKDVHFGTPVMKAAGVDREWSSYDGKEQKHIFRLFRVVISVTAEVMSEAEAEEYRRANGVMQGHKGINPAAGFGGAIAA